MRLPRKTVVIATLAIIGSAALLGGWYARDAASIARFEEARARFIESGLPKSLDELRATAASISPADNGADPYLEAAARGASVPSIEIPLWTATVSDDLRTVLDKHADVLSLIEAAAAKPRCFYRLPESADDDLPNLSPLLGLGRLLSARAVVRARDGDIEGATRDLHTLFRLGESLGNYPTLLVQIIRLGIVGTGLTALGELLPRFEDPVDALDRVQLPSVRGSTATAFKGEAAVLGTFMLSLDPGEGSGGLRAELARHRVRPDQTRYLDFLVDFSSILEKPVPEAIAEARTLAAVATESGGILTRAVAGDFPKLLEREARTQTSLVQVRVAAAVVAFRRQYGRSPASISELEDLEDVEDFEAAEASDPLTGEPFELRSTGAGLSVVSRAEDGPIWEIPR